MRLNTMLCLIMLAINVTISFMSFLELDEQRYDFRHDGCIVGTYAYMRDFDKGMPEVTDLWLYGYCDGIMQELKDEMDARMVQRLSKKYGGIYEKRK